MKVKFVQIKKNLPLKLSYEMWNKCESAAWTQNFWKLAKFRLRQLLSFFGRLDLLLFRKESRRVKLESIGAMSFYRGWWKRASVAFINAALRILYGMLILFNTVRKSQIKTVYSDGNCFLASTLFCLLSFMVVQIAVNYYMTLTCERLIFAMFRRNTPKSIFRKNMPQLKAIMALIVVEHFLKTTFC